MNDPVVIDSSSGSLIKLDADVSEGESLDSTFLKAMIEATRNNN